MITYSRHAITSMLMTLLPLICACQPDADSGSATQHSSAAPATSPAGNASADYRVYVTNEISGDLTIIDGVTHVVVATIPLGKRPRGLKISPDRNTLYVALSGSPIMGPEADEEKAPPADKQADGIGVFDIASQRLLRVIKGVSDPEQLDVSQDGRHLYIASEDTGTLCVVDVATGKTIATLPVGIEPEGVTISPNGRDVYVTSEAESLVSIVDTASNSVVKKLQVGMRPRVTAFSPDGMRAYVSSEFGATVAVVDTAARAIIHTIKLEGENVRPMGIAVAPDGKTLYVATGRGRTLVAIDAINYQVKSSVTVGERPWNAAISPDGKLVYTANGTSNDVAVVNTADMTVARQITVGNRPWGVVVR